MSDPVLRVIRLREALAIAERERDEARADRLERMMENERLKQSGGALCVERAMLEQECDHLREALATAEREKDGAFRAGAEAMREACAQRIEADRDLLPDDRYFDNTSSGARTIRALPLPEAATFLSMERETLAKAERERDALRAQNAQAYREAVVRSCDEALQRHKHAARAAESRASAAEALLREAAEVIDKLNDHPRYWDGFYEKASSLLSRIKKATNG